MAPTKKEARPAVSALAARRARQQAAAQTSASRTAASLGHGGAASTPRSSRRTASARHAVQSGLRDDEHTNDEADDSRLQVMIPLPTATQAISFRESAVSAAASPSSTTRSRRPSTASKATSIAESRPRRSSVTASAQPALDQAEATPKSAKGSAPKSQQTTPRRSNAAKGASSSTAVTPASSNKKRKSPRASNRDSSDDDLDQAVDEILTQLEFGQADSALDADVSRSKQPPRKKRASQTAKVHSPNRARRATAAQADSSAGPNRKRTPAKRSSKKAPVETIAGEESPSSDVTPERPKRANSTPDVSPMKSKSKGMTPIRAKRLLTEDGTRLQAVQRYFASTARQHGKMQVGARAMPVEDQATGFLAFGDDDQELSVASDADVDNVTAGGTQAERISGDSSEESEQEDGGEAADSGVQVRQLQRFKHSEPRPDGNQKDAESDWAGTPSASVHSINAEQSDNAQAADPALTRKALLDAIPYSNFTPVLEGDSQNMVFVENKRERAKEALYFGLQHGETLVFLGIGHVQVLRGCAQIGGAILTQAKQGVRAANIYAPICNPLPVLKSVSASEHPGQHTASARLQEEEGHDAPYFASILPRNFDTIVKVTPLSSPITALGQVCPIGGLATPFSLPPSIELCKIHQLATVKVLLAPDPNDLARKQKNVGANRTFSTAGLSATYIPNKWQSALHRLTASALSAANHPQEESVVALVRGNKKVGKSTLSRMALERLLTAGYLIGSKVAYLELDLGQSDFGPPGMVALHVFDLDDHVQSGSSRDDAEDVGGMSPQADHDATVVGAEAPRGRDTAHSGRTSLIVGPGWCQPRVPVRAHFIGDVSPRDDPEGYVAAVHDLIAYFRAEIQPGQADTQGVQQRVPLVINTQGWVKGLGADLAARLEPLLRPTHIYDVIPRGSPDPVPPPTRGRAWLDAEGAILGSGPEIVTLESVSQLEFAQGVFAPRSSNGRTNVESGAAEPNGISSGDNGQSGAGDGGSTPPRYITEVGAKLAPAESRLLNMMSYLYATGLAPCGLRKSSKITGTWDFSEPLVYRRPLVIDVRQGLQAGIRVLALGSSVPDSFKLMALNSSIVAIVVSEQGDVTAQQADKGAEQNGEATSTYKQAFDRGAQTAQAGLDSTTRCVGLGIVRSIDVASGHLHLLTPLDPAFLHEVQATTGCHIGLTKGALELPVWASLDFEAIKEARESRLQVAHAALQAAPASVAGQSEESGAAAEPLLAGLPRNQVPYLEWPHSANAAARQKGKHAASNGVGSNGTSSAPLQLGAEKRRVRRNLMRKSQFA